MSASSSTGAPANARSPTITLDRPLAASVTEAEDATAGYDEAAAIGEGWGVFDRGSRDDGSPRIELQRLDSPRPGALRFHGDEHAWRHVAATAAAGSPLHAAALAVVDPIERLAIEAACTWCPGL